MKKFVSFCMACSVAIGMFAADKSAVKEQLRTASAAHIDPIFEYYKDRSPESIALELKVNNYNAVYYFATVPTACNKDLIETLQQENIPVVLITFPCWVWVKPAEMDKFLPPNWRDWQMEFTGNKTEEHTFIGFVYPEYNQWYGEYVSKMLGDFGFDGFAMLETMYPNYNGLSYNPPQMGDISQGFRKAFEAETGYKELPEFVDSNSPLYYTKNPELTKAWEDFRVKTVNDFMFDIMSKVRSEHPDIAIASWSLGISEPGGDKKIRFYNGMDTYSMVERIQPDIHIVQTHWPDWCNPDLKPDYIKAYKFYVDEAKRACPTVKVGTQSDFGSLPEMRRSIDWVKEHRAACDEVLDNFLVYEFNIRDEVFSEAPVLKALMLNDDELLMVFDQRIADSAAATMTNRVLQAKNAEFTVKSATVDGNLLRCKLDSKPAIGTELTVPAGGIADVPQVRLKLSQHEPLPQGRTNIVPKNTRITLPVQKR